MSQYQHPQTPLSMHRSYAACRMFAALLFTLASALTTQAAAFTGAELTLQIGYCGSIKEIDAAKSAGFDYFELRTSEVAGLSDAEYDKLSAKLKQIAISTPVAYWFVPTGIKLTGPNVDKAKQAEYLERALSRMSGLGVHVIVFGSSGARNFPEGFAKQEAFDQLVDFGKRTGLIARKYGITIAIEAQRREESNIINTTQESLQWVNAVNDPNIQLMVDYYHFESEKEDPAVIAKVKDHLRHIHMANPENRVMPLNWGEYNYGPFFNALLAIGYNQTVGLEASSKDLQHDGPIAVQLLHKALTLDRSLVTHIPKEAQVSGQSDTNYTKTIQNNIP